MRTLGPATVKIIEQATIPRPDTEPLAYRPSEVPRVPPGPMLSLFQHNLTAMRVHYRRHNIAAIEVMPKPPRRRDRIAARWSCWRAARKLLAQGQRS